MTITLPREVAQAARDALAPFAQLWGWSLNNPPGEYAQLLARGVDGQMLGHAGVQMPDMKQAYAALTLLDAALAASPETDAIGRAAKVLLDHTDGINADDAYEIARQMLQDETPPPSPPKVTR